MVKWQSHSIVEAASHFTCCASMIDKVSPPMARGLMHMHMLAAR